MRAIAIERDPERAARIRRNAATLGVPHLDVVEGAAPRALAGLPAPDAVFIGGGLTRPDFRSRAGRRCAPGGRLVLNAVTIEAQAALSELSRRFGGELMQAQFARADADRPVSTASGPRCRSCNGAR